MRRLTPSRFLAALVGLLVCLPASARAAEHTLGGGVRFFETADDVNIGDLGSIEDSGNSLVLAYGVNPAGLFRFEFDLEYIEDGYLPETGEVISPKALVLLGGTLYGGAGVAIDFYPDNLASSEDASDPYFIGRLGLDLLLLPRIHLDINANYETDKFGSVFGADSDSITFGALVHFRIR